MDPVILARLQFAATTVYHFFFVPLTLGLVDGSWPSWRHCTMRTSR